MNNSGADQQPEHPLSQYNEYCIILNVGLDKLPSYQDWLEAEVMRLQSIEARAVTINNALLDAIQSMKPFLTPQVQERMQAALQPVIDLLEKKP